MDALWFRARYANMHSFFFLLYGALLCLSGKVQARSPQMNGDFAALAAMYDHRHLKLFLSATLGALQSAAILSLLLGAADASATEQTDPIIVQIDVRTPVARFLPSDVFGAGVDGLGQNGIVPDLPASQYPRDELLGLQPPILSIKNGTWR